MVDKRLMEYGLTATRLAHLTGQDPNTMHRKLRNDQGMTFGAREAAVLACLGIMDEEQKSVLDDEIEKVIQKFS